MAEINGNIRDEKGRFGAGNSGKPVGALNKSSLKIKEAFQRLIENSIDMLEADLLSLEPKDRLNYLKDLSEYILPKLARVDSTVDSKVEHTVRTLVRKTVSEQKNEDSNK